MTNDWNRTNEFSIRHSSFVIRVSPFRIQVLTSVTSLLDIPELRELDSRKSLVRIPHEEDVPLTPRVRQLIDTAEFCRLGKISQLGLVSLVYPAAKHKRLENLLGVYGNGLVYLG